MYVQNGKKKYLYIYILKVKNNALCFKIKNNK